MKIAIPDHNHVPVGTVSERFNSGIARRRGVSYFSGFHFNDAKDAVIGTHGQKLTVRTEGDGFDRLVIFAKIQNCFFVFSGLGIPQMNLVSRCQEATDVFFGVENDIRHVQYIGSFFRGIVGLIDVTAVGADFSPIPQVPNPGCSILGAGGEECAVGVVCKSIDPVGVANAGIAKDTNDMIR